MALDILTFGEALVEVMRTDVDQPLDQPALFTGPYPSGAPFIFAVQAARLGAQVGTVGAVGQDAFGKCLLDQLKTDKVDTRGIHVLPDYTTGVAFVGYKGDGSREFVFHARHAAAGQLSPQMLDKELFKGLKCLHIMGSTLSLHQQALDLGLRALELAQDVGAKISFDPNLRRQLMSPDRARYAFAPFMEAADVLMPSEEELLLLGDAYHVEAVVQDLLEDKPELVVVVTKGAEGCVVMTQSDEYSIPGIGPMVTVDPINTYDVTEVDPTGAGDCFDAGFLTRWLAGDSPSDAAQFANACGALAVTAKGPMAGARTLAEVQAFMRDNKPKEDPEYEP
ncbi:MAG: sugar kinase [Chloroflexi bacterium]|nr:sugar kinase [Chloroflexota bacterium]MCC6894011.1 sugar kinase [Anaerolineae bacterium]